MSNYMTANVSVLASLTIDDPEYWSQPTPINCTIVKIVGIFLCIGALVGVSANGALVYAYVKYSALRTPSNVFIFFLAILGLLASVTILPLTGSSCIFCHWLYHRTGCELDAIVAFLYGVSSVYLLCAVSLSRCYIILRPFKANTVTVNKCLAVAVICVVLGLLWTIAPLLGWNQYVMEASRTSCCINWYDKRPLYVSYMFSMFAGVYFIPLIILFVTNAAIFRGLKHMREKVAQGLKAGMSSKRIEMERRIVKSIIVLVVGYIITWTPYAVATFMSAAHGPEGESPPTFTFVCACFAKTSVVWIPILYISTSTQFRFRFVDQAHAAEKPTMHTAAATLADKNGGDGAAVRTVAASVGRNAPAAATNKEVSE